MAISILEKMADQSPDPILLLYGITHSFLFLKWLLQVVFLSDAISLLIFQSEGKITQNPEETREIHSHFIWVHFFLATFDLQGLAQVDNEAEIVQCVLINGTHAIVYQQWTHQKRQKENLGIVILLLIESS